MNPLNSRPELRRAFYFIQWLYNGAAALVGAYFTVTQTPLEDLPRWYVIALGIAPVLWTYLGLTAQSNVTEPYPEEDVDVDEGPHEEPEVVEDDPEPDEDDQVDLAGDDHAGD